MSKNIPKINFLVKCISFLKYVCRTFWNSKSIKSIERFSDFNETNLIAQEVIFRKFINMRDAFLKIITFLIYWIVFPKLIFHWNAYQLSKYGRNLKLQFKKNVWDFTAWDGLHKILFRQFINFILIVHIKLIN